MYDPIGSQIQSIQNPEKKQLFHSGGTELFIKLFVDLFEHHICQVLLGDLFMVKV